MIRSGTLNPTHSLTHALHIISNFYNDSVIDKPCDEKARKQQSMQTEVTLWESTLFLEDQI